MSPRGQAAGRLRKLVSRQQHRDHVSKECVGRERRREARGKEGPKREVPSGEAEPGSHTGDPPGTYSQQPL